MFSKKGDLWDTIQPWVITVFVILLMLFLYATLSGKLTGMGEALKKVLTFGR